MGRTIQGAGPTAPATNSGMRLFVAILPPPAALDELEAAAAPLRPAWPGLRWTGHSAWHVTLAFLGEVSEASAASLGPRLERAAGRHPGLSLCFSGAGAFPGGARARVLWTGLRGDRPAMASLAASVAAGARRAGAPPSGENRRFQPHLTLARCKAPSDIRPLVGELSGFAGQRWTADKIHLIRSYTGPQPRYETLGSWPLSGKVRAHPAEPAG
jgi:RNA 2',3'-cyclic 3'-phosphodiesterase